MNRLIAITEERTAELAEVEFCTNSVENRMAFLRVPSRFELDACLSEDAGRPTRDTALRVRSSVMNVLMSDILIVSVGSAIDLIAALLHETRRPEARRVVRSLTSAGWPVICWARGPRERKQGLAPEVRPLAPKREVALQV